MPPACLMPKLSDIIGRDKPERPNRSLTQALLEEQGARESWLKVDGERIRREAEKAQVPFETRDVLIETNLQLAELRQDEARRDVAAPDARSVAPLAHRRDPCPHGGDPRSHGLARLLARRDRRGGLSGSPRAVYLHEGEEHEMKSAAGLTVLIIEGESLERFRGRPTAPSAPE